jgi:hypothetical protein
MATAFKNGWVALPCGAELLLDNGIPRRLWGKDLQIEALPRVLAEAAEISGFHVAIGDWAADAQGDGREAELVVARSDLDAVLRCLAGASARLFVDRYQKPIAAEDTDWDDEAYARDLNAAMACCGVHWGELDEGALRALHRRTMHRETEALARHG